MKSLENKKLIINAVENFLKNSNWEPYKKTEQVEKKEIVNINLTTNEKKEILSQVIINRVKNNKCILGLIGADLNSFNYPEIVALMLVSNQNLSIPIINLMNPNNPFSKEVRAIQYS
tara:strand:+ start:144 stop:494 length:351 start_codon:yes stop_codon:yes gene_type:complete